MLDRAAFGEDWQWLWVMAAVTAAEFMWWGVEWSMGAAPAPLVAIYLTIAFAGLAAALALRAVLFRDWPAPNWIAAIAATIMIGIGASLFLPVKYAIPKLVPFWLDQPLAHGERALFGADPWLLLDRSLGWAAVPIDWLYAAWLPTQSLVLFSLVLQPPSSRKTHALIAYVLGWFLLGIIAALALSSAGPLFHDRILGGSAFSALRPALESRGASLALNESDAMWASLRSGNPTMVAGISAVPSIHIAISVWIALTARTMAPRAAPWAAGYAALIWIASVQLGWHYVTDGLIGAIGMGFIWAALGSVARASARPRSAAPGPDSGKDR